MYKEIYIMSLYKLVVEIDNENIDYYKIIKPIIFTEEENDIINNQDIYYINDEQIYVYISGLLSESKIVKIPRESKNLLLSINEIIVFDTDIDNLEMLKNKYKYKICNHIFMNNNEFLWFNNILDTYKYLQLNNYFSKLGYNIYNKNETDAYIDIVSYAENDEEALLKVEEFFNLKTNIENMHDLYNGYLTYINNISNIDIENINLFENIWNEWIYTYSNIINNFSIII
jgi:hypothetical protein